MRAIGVSTHMAEADDERKQRRTNRGLATALLVMVFTAGSALSAAAYFVNQPIYPNFPIGCGFAAVVLGLAAVITAGVSASMEER